MVLFVCALQRHSLRVGEVHESSRVLNILHRLGFFSVGSLREKYHLIMRVS